MRRPMLAALLITALTACSTGGSIKSPAAGGPTQEPSSVPPSATAKPLSFYAAQYLRIGKPCLAAQAALRTATTNADAIAKGKATAEGCQAANAAALRAEWPANVLVDIRASVMADGNVLGDLADLEHNAGSLVRDSGPANAAANIVHADLGLPPLK